MKDRKPAAEAPLPIGARLLGVLDLAYRARRPVLLEGPTGIGKSQIVAQFAASAGIDVMVLDLSLLEPPDLVGLPMIRDARTHYATPAELPTQGRGVLMLEELNRAEIPVMQPALQLLSARRLHAYELPEGWSTVAAVNPEEGDYHVNRLDAAMRSRFMQLTVCADRAEWLRWATRANVHPLVRRIAEDHPDVFEAAPPRSWAYVGDVLRNLRPEEQQEQGLVRAALRGYLPLPWAVLVAEALASYPPTPKLDLEAYFAPGGERGLAGLVEKLSRANRNDAIVMLASTLRSALSHWHGAADMSALERLCAPLPGDLREQCLESVADSPSADALLAGLGVVMARLLEDGYEASGARPLVQAWRKELLVHRLHLLCVGVLRALKAMPDASRVRGIEQLVSDCGPVADDLARWLRARESAS